MCSSKMVRTMPGAIARTNPPGSPSSWWAPCRAPDRIDGWILFGADHPAFATSARSHKFYKLPRTHQALFEAGDAITERARLSWGTLSRGPGYKAALA